jgi:hypothetical protein
MGLAINKIEVEKLFDEMFERDVTVEWREWLFFFYYKFCYFIILGL